MKVGLPLSDNINININQNRILWGGNAPGSTTLQIPQVKLDLLLEHIGKIGKNISRIHC